MKTKFTLKKLAIVLSFLFTLSSLTNKISAQCQAGFTWTQSSTNTISFTNTSTGVANATYYWHFSDGNTDHTANPSNFYAVPGTYWVCLTMYDSSHHACNTFCDSVVVTGTPHCHLHINHTVTNATCATCADGSASVSLAGGTPPYTFNWSTGATTHAISGAMPGLYNVCVTDSNNCVACDTFYIGNHQIAGACHASFSLHADTAVAHHYWSVNSSTGTPPLSYLWTWGDGSFDTIAHPGHGYAAAGFYTICLYISDANGCTDSMCISHHLMRGTSSAAIVSIDVLPPVTTGINEVVENIFSLYPNPVSTTITLQSFLDLQNAEIKIFNLLGETIITQTDYSNSTLDVTKLNIGIYFLQIRTSNKLFTQKFIKQ